MRDIDWIGDAARHFVALDAADDDRRDPWAPACRLCGGPHLWPACPRLDEPAIAAHHTSETGGSCLPCAEWDARLLEIEAKERAKERTR